MKNATVLQFMTDRNHIFKNFLHYLQGKWRLEVRIQNAGVRIGKFLDWFSGVARNSSRVTTRLEGLRYISTYQAGFVGPLFKGISRQNRNRKDLRVAKGSVKSRPAAFAQLPDSAGREGRCRVPFQLPFLQRYRLSLVRRASR